MHIGVEIGGIEQLLSLFISAPPFAVQTEPSFSSSPSTAQTSYVAIFINNVSRLFSAAAPIATLFSGKINQRGQKSYVGVRGLEKGGSICPNG